MTSLASIDAYPQTRDKIDRAERRADPRYKALRAWGFTERQADHLVRLGYQFTSMPAREA